MTKIKLGGGDVPLLVVREDSDAQWRLLIYHEGEDDDHVLVQVLLNPLERLMLARALIAPTPRGQ